MLQKNQIISAFQFCQWGTLSVADTFFNFTVIISYRLGSSPLPTLTLSVSGESQEELKYKRIVSFTWKYCKLRTLPGSRLGACMLLGGDTAGTAESYWPEGFPTPHDVMLSNKIWETKKEAGGCSEWCRLFSQVTATHNCACLAWRWLSTWLPMGNSERNPCLALLIVWGPWETVNEILVLLCLLCEAFVLLIKLFLSQPICFLTSTLLIHSPVSLEVEEGWVSGCVVLSCPPGLNHDSVQLDNRNNFQHQVATSWRCKNI